MTGFKPVQSPLARAFIQRVRTDICEHNLLTSGEKVLLAVSGGVDSMVLLHVMVQLARGFQWDLHAAHLHHGIRQEADRDQEQVKQACEVYQIPLYDERVNIPALAKEGSTGLEATARQERYRFLHRIAKQVQCQKIATGHHTNDQAETVLMNMLRGTGITGLGGISWHRDQLIRPLLSRSRLEIQTYAEDQGVRYCEDYTNRDLSYRRNRIRHELIPRLESEYNRGLVSNLTQLAEVCQQTDAILRQQASEAFETCAREVRPGKIILDIEAFLAYFNVLHKYILGIALERVGESRRILNQRSLSKIGTLLRHRRSTKSIVLGESELRVEPTGIVLSRRHARNVQLKTLERIPGVCPLWGSLFLEIKKDSQPLERIKKNKNQSIAWIDADHVVEPLWVRSPHHGDRFQPLGMCSMKKVSDVLIDTKVPHHQRSEIPVVGCGDRIVWVAGVRLDHRVRVTNTTRHMLKLVLKNA